MKSTPTLFDGNVVILDASVIINYHSVLALNKLLSWAKGELAVTEIVAGESKYSAAGPIDINSIIASGRLSRAPLTTPTQLRLFAEYVREGIQNTHIDDGEASVLVAALTAGCGIACDEKDIRDEFKRKAPNKICISSWGIARLAKKKGFITQKDCDDYCKGFLSI